ncbi:integrase core domain-containing protein, partial [Escherichia coli]
RGIVFPGKSFFSAHEVSTCKISGCLSYRILDSGPDGTQTTLTVERRFGNELPASPVEWLTDNGSCYRANETRQFARMLGLEPKNTAVRSPESNGIAESFVKTIKRDYISIMPKPDGLTAAKNLAEAFEHYNEWHPHSALGYRSPREYLRQQASNGLSDNRCLEI